MSYKPAQLVLLGSPALYDADGKRVPIHSKKALALLAMLATAKRGERSRVWLQDKLWGSRPTRLAQSSLRRDVANLKRLLVQQGLDLIDTDALSIRLKSGSVVSDIADAHGDLTGLEFLEGIDITGEEGFEDWLRETRISLAERARPPSSGDVRVADKAVVIEKSTPADAGSPEPGKESATDVEPVLVLVPPANRMGSDSGFATAEAVRAAIVDIAYRFRMLPLVIPDPGPHRRENAWYAKRYRARYLFRTEILDGGADTQILFTFLEMPGEIVRWTERRPILDSATREGNLMMEVARAVHCAADIFELTEMRRLRDENPGPDSTPASIAIKARHHLRSFTFSDVETAEALVETGLALFPGDPELLLTLANVTLWRHWLVRSGEEAIPRLRQIIKKAQRADPSDCRGHLFAGILDIWHGDIRAARRSLKEACRLNPFYSDALVHYGASFYLDGEAQAALRPIEDALFIAPLDDSRFFAKGELAMVHYMLGNYERCLELVAEIQTTHSGYILSHILEVASLMALGLTAAAAAARAKLIDHDPGLSEAMLEWVPFRDPKWTDTLRAAVASAQSRIAS